MNEKKEKDQEQKQEEQPSAEPKVIDLSPAEIEELKKKAADFAQLQERLLRSAADFENAKKRLAREREDFIKYAVEDFVFSLLPVLDNFNFALSHISGDDDKARSLREGFLLIQKQLQQVLAERGSKPVDSSAGKLFDPHRHEAVGSVCDEKKPEGTIIEEIQTGYELNGKLLRPAKVKISTHHEVQEEKSEELT